MSETIRKFLQDVNICNKYRDNRVVIRFVKTSEEKHYAMILTEVVAKANLTFNDFLLQQLSHNEAFLYGEGMTTVEATQALEEVIKRVKGFDAYYADQLTQYVLNEGNTNLEGVWLHPKLDFAMKDYFTKNENDLYSDEYMMSVIPTRYGLGVVAMLHPVGFDAAALSESYGWHRVLNHPLFPGAAGNNMEEAITKLKAKAASIPCSLDVHIVLEKAFKCLKGKNDSDQESSDAIDVLNRYEPNTIEDCQTDLHPAIVRFMRHVSGPGKIEMFSFTTEAWLNKTKGFFQMLLPMGTPTAQITPEVIDRMLEIKNMPIDFDVETDDDPFDVKMVENNLAKRLIACKFTNPDQWLEEYRKFFSGDLEGYRINSLNGIELNDEFLS